MVIFGVVKLEKDKTQTVLSPTFEKQKNKTCEGRGVLQ